LRSIESAIAADFDLLAGSVMAGKNPLVVEGFYVVSTAVTAASSLQLQVADSTLIHFFASESGSVFHVPADRANEVLNTTNPKITGSWTPSTVNFVGLDLIRSADASTTDLVEFIDVNTELEDPHEVPLARTLDYRIIISTQDFDSRPGVAPLARVLLDSVGNVTDIQDARQFFFRLGEGGTVPNPGASFHWPAGRNEVNSGDPFAGGDKAITNFKGWMNSVMTRLWEVGGGEYWYSSTEDRNVAMARAGSPFVSTGENFEFISSNLHWKGLVIVFSNSTGFKNAIADQTTDLAGLTDLADGECIYVDLDRTQDRTGGLAISAQKAPLTLLGDPSTPGTRWVIAWRYGSEIHVRDQSYAVGASLKDATVLASGSVKLSATDSAPISPAHVATVDSQTFTARAAGLSRGYLFGPATPSVSDFIGGSGDIIIGGGSDGADGFGGGNPVDHNVILQIGRTQDEIKLNGVGDWLTHGVAGASIANNNTSLGYGNLILRLIGREFLGGVSDHVHVFLDGSFGFDNILFGSGPITPAPVVGAQIRSKFFFRDNGVASPNKRDQFCVMGWDGAITPLWSSNPY
jgi:hypothetical protein